MINDTQSKSIEIYILYDCIKISFGLWTSIDVHLNTMLTYWLTPECGRLQLTCVSPVFCADCSKREHVQICLHMRWPDYPFNTWTERWTEHLRQVLLFCRWAFAGNRTGVTQVTHFWATCLTPEASSTEPVPEALACWTIGFDVIFYCSVGEHSWALALMNAALYHVCTSLPLLHLIFYCRSTCTVYLCNTCTVWWLTPVLP